MDTLPQRSGSASGKLPVWIVPAVLLTAFAAQSLSFIATQSLTYDEPAHIIAGLEAWQQGRFEQWNDHPPLGRLWLTLPVSRTQAQFSWQKLPTGFRVEAMTPGPEWFAIRVRVMNTLLGLALGSVLWFATRRLFSTGAANVALCLFAFTPSLIAHFSVATTDGIGTFFIFLSAFQLVRWRANPTWTQTVLLGLVLGGLMLSKFYAPPMVLLALGLMLVLQPSAGLQPPSRWNWSKMASAAAVMLVVLWAGYFFHTSRLTIVDGQVSATYPNRAQKVWATKSHARINAIVPAGEFFEGLREVALSNRRGRPAWFLGHIHPKGGIRLYYPVAIALKWPPIFLALLVLSLALGVRKTSRAPGDLLILSLFALLYLVFAIQSKYDIGERHILPLYPFALLVAGGLWQHAGKHRFAAAALGFALLLNAADCLRSAPDYLAYFTPFVASENRWRLLTDSNLDWGQGLIALRDYQRKHPNETVKLAYFGSIDPVLYGVRADMLTPGERPESGPVIVGASCLSGQVLENPDAYRWLWSYHPKAVIDGSLWLFDIASPKSSTP